MREFKRARFSNEMPGNIGFEGFTDGASWNGWACPYFTREIAENVLRASEKNGYIWSYDNKSAAFLVRHTDDPEDFEPERFGGVSILAEGHEAIVYAIGAYSWAWEICHL